MHPFDPHRTIAHQTEAETGRMSLGDSKSLEGSPSFEKVFREIGLILLICLGLPVAVELVTRLAAFL